MSNPLIEKFKNIELILASGSPRRKELLKGLDIPFIIKTKEIDEVYPSNLKAHEITDFLAKLKSDAFTDISNKTIVITSDTIVWLDDKAVMKPKNRAEAIEILSSLSNKTHQVFTSVCIKSNSKTRVFFDMTKVFFKNLSNKEIVYYVDTYKPYDKAGSYGAQDWIGYIAINKMEGSYFNVMGLPVHKLYKELLEF